MSSVCRVVLWWFWNRRQTSHRQTRSAFLWLFCKHVSSQVLCSENFQTPTECLYLRCYKHTDETHGAVLDYSMEKKTPKKTLEQQMEKSALCKLPSLFSLASVGDKDKLFRYQISSISFVQCHFKKNILTMGIFFFFAWLGSWVSGSYRNNVLLEVDLMHCTFYFYFEWYDYEALLLPLWRTSLDEEQACFNQKCTRRRLTPTICAKVKLPVCTQVSFLFKKTLCWFHKFHIGKSISSVWICYFGDMLFICIFFHFVFKTLHIVFVQFHNF